MNWNCQVVTWFYWVCILYLWNTLRKMEPKIRQRYKVVYTATSLFISRVNAKPKDGTYSIKDMSHTMDPFRYLIRVWMYFSHTWQNAFVSKSGNWCCFIIRLILFCRQDLTVWRPVLKALLMLAPPSLSLRRLLAFDCRNMSFFLAKNEPRLPLMLAAADDCCGREMVAGVCHGGVLDSSP